MSFNLADYMDDKLKDGKTAGKDFMKFERYEGDREVFRYWFKGRYATFYVVDKRLQHRDGKIGKLFTLTCGKRGSIYYEGFREPAGELIFLGESATQIVDKEMRTREAIKAGKFN